MSVVTLTWELTEVVHQVTMKYTIVIRDDAGYIQDWTAVVILWAASLASDYLRMGVTWMQQIKQKAGQDHPDQCLPDQCRLETELVVALGIDKALREKTGKEEHLWM